MPTVKFVKEKKSIEVADGANLRKEAMKNGIELYAGPHKVLNCHGFGTCGSCNVHVRNPDNANKAGWFERLRLWLGPLTSLKILSHEDGEVRLACKTRVQGDVEVETQPPINWHGEKFWN